MAQSQPGKKTLLLIDDEPDMVEVMFTILDSRETHVLLALNGHEALELLKTHEVDAVLTDIKMPEMSGLELIENIRRMGLATPVVMMSGYADVETILEALRWGVFDVIEKPFVRERMLTTLKRALTIGEAVRGIHSELKRVVDEKGMSGNSVEMLRYLAVFLAQQELARQSDKNAA